MLAEQAVYEFVRSFGSMILSSAGCWQSMVNFRVSDQTKTAAANSREKRFDDQVTSLLRLLLLSWPSLRLSFSWHAQMI